MGFKDDSSGQIFSIDLLIALIPITLVIGMVAADMDNMFYLVQDTVYRGTTDRVASDTVNTLLATSGTPPTWEQTNSSTRIVGLAKYDFNKGSPIEGTISSAKADALNAADIQNIVGDNYGFYMKISIIDNTSSPVSYTSIYSLGTLNNSANDIVRIERVALYSKLNVVSQIIGQIRGVGATRQYTNPPDQFPTSYFYTQNYDYYVLFNNHGYSQANVTINNQTMIINNLNQAYKINSSSLKYNQTTPDKMYNNTVLISAIAAPGNSMDAYIVQVPTGTSTDIITLNNVQPKSSRIEFYLWSK